MFDSPHEMALGLLTGVVFGFLLQKGRVTKYRVIMGQLLLRDFTVAKVMLTAVAVGSVGVYALVGAGHAELQVKPAEFAGVLIGALLFGGGLAVVGLCPGTTVAACGEGRRDAIAGALGMLAGATIYVLAHAPIAALSGALGSWGEATWPEVTASSPWAWIVALLAITAAVRLLASRRWPRSEESAGTA